MRLIPIQTPMPPILFPEGAEPKAATMDFDLPVELSPEDLSSVFVVAGDVSGLGTVVNPVHVHKNLSYLAIARDSGRKRG